MALNERVEGTVEMVEYDWVLGRASGIASLKEERI